LRLGPEAAATQGARRTGKSGATPRTLC
jgi:hypothetical protein